jgi:hypothetical protein
MESTLMIHPAILRSKKRSAKRGAAMVEGAFMALIMCLIWNLMVYCAGMYLAKLESVYVVKYSTFWYASHDCGLKPLQVGAPPSYKAAIFGPVTTLNQNDSGQKDQDCPSNNAGNGTPDCTSVQGKGFGKQQFFSKGHTDTKFTWSWQRPQWWATALSGDGTVGSDSYVMCNEGPYGLKVWDFLGSVLSQVVSNIGGS